VEKKHFIFLNQIIIIHKKEFFLLLQPNEKHCLEQQYFLFLN